MFSWICQECGREVPPSYSECPTCAERKRGPAPPPPPKQPQGQYPPQHGYPPPQQGYAPPAPPPQRPQQSYAPPAPPPPPQYAQQPMYAPPPPPPGAYNPPPQYAPPQPQYAPPQPPQYPPAPHPNAAPPLAPNIAIPEEKSGPPPWLVTLLVMAVIIGAGYLLYAFVLTGKSSSSTPAATKAGEAAQAEGAAAGVHPYAKYLEVTGVRLTETNNKPTLKLTVVNHSAADMTGVELKGELTIVNSKDDSPIATFTAKVGSIGPYDAKDVTAPVETKMRAYELPDWQFLKAKFDITSPR